MIKARKPRGSLFSLGRQDLLACCHSRAGVLIADGETSVAVWLLKDLEHAIKEAVLLDNCDFVISVRRRSREDFDEYVSARRVMSKR